ncbi:GNAT family N-acetyltransferase [Sphingobacterium oryzagri]|uniref:GNAT family N-acetyltransferase n=1 Tax=Sphingobacterium oryzagri TaxID=3025669 RepID=A0ABY7WHF4_9SPHI|nr:GNAT family N-acetyltransferase [Sphingobacterium sp. KACC 22765]WDF67705.1 GNAT family N-acetyltransferase [Sphingobacterium sp. KACC 22765]
MIEIKQEDGRKGKFELFVDGALAGEMTYTWAGDDKFIIDHTEVKAGFEGQGLGKKLVLAAVDFARAKHAKVMPLCPYAKRVFDKSPDLKDILF